MLSYAEAVYYMLNGESGDGSGTSKPKQLKITDRWTDTITPPQDRPNTWWNRVQVDVPKTTVTLTKNKEKVLPSGKNKGYSQVSVAIPMHSSESFKENKKSFAIADYISRSAQGYTEDQAGWITVRADPRIFYKDVITANGTYTYPQTKQNVEYAGVKHIEVNVPQEHTQQEIDDILAELALVNQEIENFDCPNDEVDPPSHDEPEEEWDTGDEDPDFPDIVAAFPNKEYGLSDLTFKPVLYGNGNGTTSPAQFTIADPQGNVSTHYIGLYIKWYVNGRYTYLDLVQGDTTSPNGKEITTGGVTRTVYPMIKYKDLDAEVVTDGERKFIKVTCKVYTQRWEQGYLGYSVWVGPPDRPEYLDSSWITISKQKEIPVYSYTTWKVK